MCYQLYYLINLNQFLNTFFINSASQYFSQFYRGQNQMDKIFKQIFSYILKATSTLLSYYTKHQWYQFVLLIPMIIVAFIYGRSQQNKQLETVLSKLNNTDQYKLDISKQRTKSSSRLNNTKSYLKTQLFFLGSLIVFTLIYYLTSAGGIIKINPPVFLIIYAVTLVVIVFTFLMKKWYHNSCQRLNKQIQDVFQEEKKDVKIIEKYLGEKVIEKLKARFVKSLKIDEEIKNKEPCKKKNCLSKIKIYKQSFDFFDKIIKGMLSYDWCDFCKQQLETPRQKLSDITLEEIKIGGKSLDDMKRFFNSLLQFYNTKKADLEKVCKNQCCKQFYQVLKPLSEEHYKQYKMFDEQLKLLK